MKNWEVILDKPALVDDWCIWDNRDIKVQKDFTVALVVAFSEERLKQKLDKLYPGVRVIKYKQV